VKLQTYDNFLNDREKQLKLLNNMQNGDFSHLSEQFGVLAHQSTNDIIQTLIPQLMAHQENSSDEEVEFDDKTSKKRARYSLNQNAVPESSKSVNHYENRSEI